jgi:hypothetical protein
MVFVLSFGTAPLFCRAHKHILQIQSFHSSVTEQVEDSLSLLRLCIRI